MSQTLDYGWGTVFTLLKRHGFAPECIVDVGANHGNWTREALAHFPGATFLLVEPQDHLRAHVADLLALDGGRKVRWITAGAGERAEKMLFTIAPRDDSSTFACSPELAKTMNYRQTMIDVRRIDEIVATEGVPVPHIVKIDAEGFDLKAVAGASALYGKTDVFFVEAAVCATVIENTMAAVIRKMDDIGYRMFDITDINRSPKHGVLWLCEMAFMRKDCPLLEKISSYE